MDKYERKNKIKLGLLDPVNWKPNFSRIAELNNIPITTIHAYYNKLIQQNRIILGIYILNEEEAHTIFLEKKLKEIKEKELEELQEED